MPAPPPMFRPAHALLLLLIPIALQGVALVRFEEQAREGELATQRAELSFLLEGRPLAVESSLGDVTIVASEGDRTYATAELRYLSSDEEWMEEIREHGLELELDEGLQRVTLRAKLPDRPKRRTRFLDLLRGEWRKVEMDLQLRVPVGTRLELDQRHGDVSVSGVGGELKLAQVSGSARIEGAAGKVEIDNRHGDLEVRGVDGTLQVRMSSGAVDVERVSGETRVENRYGRIRLASVGGSLVVSSQSGAVEIRDADDDVRVDSSYAKVSIQDVAGNLEVEARSAPVHLARIGGDVQVTGSYAEIEIAEVGGRTTIESPGGEIVIRQAGGPVSVVSRNGQVLVEGTRAGLRVRGQATAVKAREIAGAVDIQTRNAPIDVAGVGGAINIVNGGGEVMITGLAGAALSAQHRVEATHGGIDFTWPDELPPPAFRLESTFGEPRADFPASVTKDGSHVVLTSPAETGTSPQITLIARNGSPRLHRP